MHALAVIKNACAEALDEEPGSLAEFHAIVDPGSVYEMAAMLEDLTAEVERLGGNAAPFKAALRLP